VEEGRGERADAEMLKCSNAEMLKCEGARGARREERGAGSLALTAYRLALGG